MGSGGRARETTAKGLMEITFERIPADDQPQDETNTGCGWHYIFREKEDGKPERGFRLTIADEVARQFGAKNTDALVVLYTVVNRGRYGENLVAPESATE